MNITILDIEQGDDRWHEERHGCVTGTKFESAIGACYSAAKGQWSMGGKTFEFQGSKLAVVKEGKIASASLKKQDTLMMELISDCQSIVEIDDYCNETMERGNDLEPTSVRKASVKHKVNFEPCGMLLSSEYPRFKFSPDAIVKDADENVIGGYETKSKAGKKHIEYQINGVIPSEHLMQCLCPMVMCDSVKYWIFGHYDDRNMVNDLFTTGIKRSDYQEFIDCAREVLKAFFLDLDENVKNLGGEYNG